MNDSKLNAANNLRNKIRNLETVVKDIENSAGHYDGFQTHRGYCTIGQSSEGTYISDKQTNDEILAVVKKNLERYKKEFEEL